MLGGPDWGGWLVPMAFHPTRPQGSTSWPSAHLLAIMVTRVPALLEGGCTPISLGPRHSRPKAQESLSRWGPHGSVACLLGHKEALASTEASTFCLYSIWELFLLVPGCGFSVASSRDLGDSGGLGAILSTASPSLSNGVSLFGFVTWDPCKRNSHVRELRQENAHSLVSGSKFLPSIEMGQTSAEALPS